VSDLPSTRHVYSPHERTALVLTGTGTAGAYHAGVLRALDEAGVKIDVVAGRGIGAVSALFAAVDASERLWGPQGFWRGREVAALYPWRSALRAIGWIAAAGVLLLTIPAAVAAIGLLGYQVALMLPLGDAAAARLAEGYGAWVSQTLAPGGLTRWLPRAALLLTAIMVAVVLIAGRRAVLALPARQRQRDGLWWEVLAAPVSRTRAAGAVRSRLWQSISGGAALRQPPPADLARRYAELLAENLGQPRFRELLLVVHDLDARRDLAFALLDAAHRRAFFLRPAATRTDPRSSEAIDLAGVARDLTLDAVEAALALPVAVDPPLLVFPSEHYWRGEAHRLCDRPSALVRVLEEAAHAGARQVVLATGAAEADGPHALSTRRTSPRARLGDFLASEEAAAVRDALGAAEGWFEGIFVIRPGHNPVGPLDLAGAYDERSDRHQPLTELVERGYEDAYRQFIEPVVGASGEALGDLTT
jgi:hypothetical protein